jgi:hypothetical protein
MPRSRLTDATVIVGLLIAVVGSWILGTPRNGGPDETSHAVASAALILGLGEGDVNESDTRFQRFEVPAMVGEPNPACWAFDEETPVACAGQPVNSTQRVLRDTTAADYPVWGHVLPGLAALLPWPAGYAYLARLLAAALPLMLMAAALARLRRQSPVAALGAALGLTPIIWFSMGLINPSSLAIGGALAVWVALLTPHPRVDWLLSCGALALLLPRRDGPIWATMIVVTVCLLCTQLPSELWRGLDRIARTSICVGLALTILPVLTGSGDRRELALSVAPVALLAVEVIGRAWRRFRPSHPTVCALVVGGVGAGLALGFASVVRPGGADMSVLQRIVGGTDRHLEQMVGVLGWLDTPVPGAVHVLWWAAFGGLVALCLVGVPRQAFVTLGALVATVVVAWVLELGFGERSASYWQGRYSMPVVVGLPIALALGVRLHGDQLARVSAAMCWASLAVWNGAFIAAQRRWGVGTSGTMYPWRWDTWHAPIRPDVLIILHAISSALLIRWLAARSWARVGHE